MIPRYVFSTRVKRCDTCGLQTHANSPLVQTKPGVFVHPDCFSQSSRQDYEEYAKTQRIERMTDQEAQ